MLIRRIIKITRAYYVNVPVEIARKMSLGYGDDVCIGLTDTGAMYVVPFKNPLTPSDVKCIARDISIKEYGKPVKKL